jgi:hypothetical protein
VHEHISQGKWERCFAVGDVGQAPEVEDLAGGEGAGCDKELAGVAAPASVMRRVAPATIEHESHLTRSSTWCASCRGVETIASIVVHRVSLSVGLWWLRTQRRHNNLSWLGLLGPYI